MVNRMHKRYVDKSRLIYTDIWRDNYNKSIKVRITQIVVDAENYQKMKRWFCQRYYDLDLASWRICKFLDDGLR